MTYLRSGNGGARTQTSLLFQPGFPSPLPTSGSWKPKGALIMMVKIMALPLASPPRPPLTQLRHLLNLDTLLSPTPFKKTILTNILGRRYNHCPH